MDTLPRYAQQFEVRRVAIKVLPEPIRGIDEQPKIAYPAAALGIVYNPRPIAKATIMDTRMILAPLLCIPMGTFYDGPGRSDAKHPCMGSYIEGELTQLADHFLSKGFPEAGHRTSRI